MWRTPGQGPERAQRGPGGPGAPARVSHHPHPARPGLPLTASCVRVLEDAESMGYRGAAALGGLWRSHLWVLRRRHKILSKVGRIRMCLSLLIN